MRMIPPTLPLAGALAMFAALAGCTQESNPGGPGVSSNPKTTTSSTSTVKSDGYSRETMKEQTAPNVVDKANTFTLHAPKMETTLDTGKKRDVDISISRGSEFKQSVKLEFKAPSGVMVTPTMATMRKSRPPASR